MATKKQEEARKFLEDLEKKPEHTTRTKQADDQTRDDDINDPKFHNKEKSKNPHKDDDNIDADWKLSKNGHWYREGGE